MDAKVQNKARLDRHHCEKEVIKKDITSEGCAFKCDPRRIENIVKPLNDETIVKVPDESMLHPTPMGGPVSHNDPPDKSNDSIGTVSWSSDSHRVHEDMDLEDTVAQYLK